LQPTLLALQAGKHVIVEKPITTDPEEARQILAASRKYDRYAMPGHLLRFEPKYAEIKQIIENGQIGKPTSIYLKRSRENGLFAIYQRTHTVYELMIHDLDQAIWYAGSKVKKVYATGRSVTGSKTPEILWAQLQFESGTVAVLHSNWMTPDAAGIAINDYTEVIGEKGTVHFDTNLAGVQVWTGSGRATTDVSIHHRQNGRVIGCLAEQLNYVGQCILYGRNPDLISFEDALHGIEVADAIVKSATEGKEIIL
jgi:predicted dehydrogenase